MFALVEIDFPSHYDYYYYDLRTPTALGDMCTSIGRGILDPSFNVYETYGPQTRRRGSCLMNSKINRWRFCSFAAELSRFTKPQSMKNPEPQVVGTLAESAGGWITVESRDTWITSAVTVEPKDEWSKPGSYEPPFYSFLVIDLTELLCLTRIRNHASAYVPRGTLAGPLL
ncbi:hypothetical protein EDB92DRAFT_1831965 [Lactarius akahatsu]|uniref:Uncharacterized protein n=1 Tax=Lactarius akahatsu TaxID=416441 RepID=A0AAD4QHG5_9AGAM|nr:hypothetical protein EDB92DRAFT_1831965 [Lactarius akahatsu]